MKNLKTQILTVILLLLFTVPLKAQDYIISKSGKTINCDITKITKDTIFFTMKVGENKANTFMEKTNIKELHIYYLDQIKENFDSSLYFNIELKDGTELFGKIKKIQGTQIIFDDNLLNKITINSESIVNINKENPNGFYRIILQNGKEIHGTLIERRKTEVDVKTESLGLITISSANVKQMEEIEKEKIVEGEYWFPNPNSTRYLFAPSAMSLKKGEGYYQNAYILANSANYGVNDNVSMGGGVVLPGAAFLTPKVGFQVSEKFHLGAGSIFGIISGPTFAGILYGLATYGTLENNITLGTGFAYFDEKAIDRPIITLSGMIRISRKVALVSENWGFPAYEKNYNYNTNSYTGRNYYYVAASYGVRIMNEKITFDVALINTKDLFEVIPIGVPYIDFVYKFQK